MRIILLAFGVMAMLAAPASAAPVPSYTVAPDPPIAGEAATFTSTSTSTGTGITEVAWDFSDGSPEVVDTAAPFTVDHTYPNAGSRTLRMRVTDDTGQMTAFFPITVNARPVAQFSFSPTAPVAGQEVFFQSFSYDPGAGSPSLAWDTDGDGAFDDGTGENATRAFSSAGAHQVSLRATDSDGVSHTATRLVNVGPAPASPLPVAQFSVSPVEPTVGQQVSLRSFSYDPDGSIVSQRWDLDGDGDFDERVETKSAFTVFATAGPATVRLQVRDSEGGVQTDTQTISVKRQIVKRSSPSLINPFPVIRMAGSVYPRGVRVKALEAKAPRSSRVTVRCRGKSCPSKKISKRARGRRVRFRRMTRFLRAGTVISVSVRKGGQIGKYTRWRIRAGRLPKRRDLCLYPRRRKAARCPD